MRVPETIFLQWFGDYDPDMLSESERDGIDPYGASWCWEQIFPADIEYVRKDAATKAMRMLQAEYKEMAQQVVELRLELRRYQEREATMGWNQSRPPPNAAPCILPTLSRRGSGSTSTAVTGPLLAVTGKPRIT